MDDDDDEDQFELACPECGAPDPQPSAGGMRCMECDWHSEDE